MRRFKVGNNSAARVVVNWKVGGLQEFLDFQLPVFQRQALRRGSDFNFRCRRHVPSHALVQSPVRSRHVSKLGSF